MRSFFLSTIGVVLIAWSFYIVLHKPAPLNYQGNTITIEGKVLEVEVADTDPERMQGLSNHAPLLPGHGMLFVFDNPQIISFWMKDMTFPIDIVWLEKVDNEFKIVGIERNVGPNTFPNTFSPSRAVQYVVETNPYEL